MTLKQTAELLQVSYDHLWELVTNGGNHPPYMMLGKRRRFVKEQVIEWMKSQSNA